MGEGETEIAERIFNTLLDHLTHDEDICYSNIFNRVDADSEVVVLASEVLRGLQ